MRVPSWFVWLRDARDRKAYRRAIERWEAEGGATVDRDDTSLPPARGMRRANEAFNDVPLNSDVGRITFT
jgi:hypothetical protein